MLKNIIKATNELDEHDIENEKLYPEGIEEITKPYNPKDVNITSKVLTVSNIVSRLKNNEIILDPDYQRNTGLWKEREQSRLIESLMILIPLPAFYFVQCNDDSYEVVDGIQRLTAIRRFIAEPPTSNDKLRLKNLEYVLEYEGKTYEELPRSIQRRIDEQNINVYIIEKGTDDRIKESIFTRINTGGLTLTKAEIRNAIYHGQASDFVKELALSEEFITATRGSIRGDRMMDREFVTRFFAFYLLDYNNYIGRFEEYLSAALERLSKARKDELEEYRTLFLDTMKFCHSIFEGNAFRRFNDGKYGIINKPLFDVVAVSFARLDQKKKNQLLEHKEVFITQYKLLFKNEEFRGIISNATATKANIDRRYEMIREIIEDTLND